MENIACLTYNFASYNLKILQLDSKKNWNIELASHNFNIKDEEFIFRICEDINNRIYREFNSKLNRNSLDILMNQLKNIIESEVNILSLAKLKLENGSDISIFETIDFKKYIYIKQESIEKILRENMVAYISGDKDLYKYLSLDESKYIYLELPKNNLDLRKEKDFNLNILINDYKILSRNISLENKGTLKIEYDLSQNRSSVVIKDESGNILKSKNLTELGLEESESNLKYKDQADLKEKAVDIEENLEFEGSKKLKESLERELLY